MPLPAARSSRLAPHVRAKAEQVPARLLHPGIAGFAVRVFFDSVVPQRGWKRPGVPLRGLTGDGSVGKL